MIYKCKVVLVIVILHSKHNSIYQNNDDDKDVKYGPCNHPQEVESEPGSITKIVKSGVPWVLNDFTVKPEFTVKASTSTVIQRIEMFTMLFEGIMVNDHLLLILRLVVNELAALTPLCMHVQFIVNKTLVKLITLIVLNLGSLGKGI